VRDPVLQRHFRHGHRNFDIGWPIVQAEQQMVVYIDHEILTYLVIAPTSDAKSSNRPTSPASPRSTGPGGHHSQHIVTFAQYARNATNGPIGWLRSNLPCRVAVAKRNAVAALQFSQGSRSQK